MMMSRVLPLTRLFPGLLPGALVGLSLIVCAASPAAAQTPATAAPGAAPGASRGDAIAAVSASDASVDTAAHAGLAGRLPDLHAATAIGDTPLDREARDATAGAAAQRRGAPRGASGSSEPAVRINVIFHVGTLALSAKDSFDAILGSSSGVVFGGGAEVALRRGLFIRGDVSRFSEDGERVFVSNGQVFPLGQPLTVTLTPIEFTGGYRFFTRGAAGARRGLRLQPYAGGGVGVVRYREESSSDASGEAVSENFTSYHLLLGLDVPFSRMFSAGVEYQRRWVPDGLGQGGVSQAFDETDLGGQTFRAQFRVHF